MITYIAIGPYCWGRATTSGEAIRGMKRAKPTFIPKERLPYRLYLCADDATVNEQGDICSNEPPRKIREVSFVGDQRIVKEF